MNKQLLLLL